MSLMMKLVSVASWFLWSASAGSLLWWSVEMCSLAAQKSVDSPTLSADRSDYAAVPGIAAWLLTAFVSLIVEDILRFARSLPHFIATLSRVRSVGILVAYSWSAATLSKFKFTYSKHHIGLNGLGIQTTAIACAILADALRDARERTPVEVKPADAKRIDAEVLSAVGAAAVRRNMRSLHM